MNGWTPNLPEAAEEVRECRERYEQALIETDVETLGAAFWDSPRTGSSPATRKAAFGENAHSCVVHTRASGSG